MKTYSPTLTIVIISLLFAFPSKAQALESIQINRDNAEIRATIRYTVIGLYDSRFEKFRGQVTYDKETKAVSSVNLVFDTETITSNCEWCDKIVRSDRLLAAEEYPEITFKSSEIFKDEEGYKVRGSLAMHGVVKEYVFPFSYENIIDARTGKETLKLVGHWDVARKDFNITWNKYLDNGGVLVSNTINVDWTVQLPLTL